MADDFETRFLAGIAHLLDAETDAVYKPASRYLAGDLAVTFETIPQSPDGVVVLAAYGVDDDPSLSDSVIGLQVTTRRAGQDPTLVRATAGQVYDALHGLHDVALPGGVHLVQSLLRSHTSIGQDQSSRWRRVQNFYCTVHRPSPHRQ